MLVFIYLFIYQLWIYMFHKYSLVSCLKKTISVLCEPQLIAPPTFLKEIPYKTLTFPKDNNCIHNCIMSRQLERIT